MATILATLSRLAGTYTTSSFSYSGAGTVDFGVVSLTWALDDPSIVVNLRAQQSFDGGSSWEDVFASRWSPEPLTGLPGLPAPSAPSGGFRVSDGRGTRSVRALLTQSGILAMGLTATAT